MPLRHWALTETGELILHRQKGAVKNAHLFLDRNQSYGGSLATLPLLLGL